MSLKRKIEISVGSVRCFVEDDARVRAADTDLFHLVTVQAHSGSLKLLTVVVLNRHGRFSLGLALFDDRGGAIQFHS